jgi:hypothetical protein
MTRDRLPGVNLVLEIGPVSGIEVLHSYLEIRPSQGASEKLSRPDLWKTLQTTRNNQTIKVKTYLTNPTTISTRWICRDRAEFLFHTTRVAIMHAFVWLLDDKAHLWLLA